MKTLLACFIVLAASCGAESPSQPSIRLALFPASALEGLTHPESDSAALERTERNLVVYEPSVFPEGYPLAAVPVLGHVHIGDSTTLGGDEDNAPANIVNESCSSACVCPQATVGWWEKSHIVVSDEMRTSFGPDLEEHIVSVDICETPTSLLWSQNAQAFQPLE